MNTPANDTDPQVRAVLEFKGRLDALTVSRGDGLAQMNIGELRALVRENPELSTVACRNYVQLAKEDDPSWHGYAQTAHVIAAAYEAEFDDDTLSTWVGDELAAAGLSVRSPTVESPEPAPPQLIHFDVDSEALARKDIYPLVKAYSHFGADESAKRIAQLRAGRGRLLLTFAVPLSDPREVWEVPEVRDYVALLNERLPYLPYFFDPDPQRPVLQIWISCLAPAHALVAGGGVNLSDDDLLTELAWTMQGVRQFARFLGEDPGEVCGDVFGMLPDTYVAMLRKLVVESYGS